MIRLASLFLVASVAIAGACEQVLHDDRLFTICTADLSRQEVSLHLNGADGMPLGSFTALDQVVEAPIAFAMNGGMYHPDRRPVGLYVEDGVKSKNIVLREGPGNFGLLPNGVFCIQADRADVIESRAFDAASPACDDATQSGPMLVIDGALHPRFLPDSTSFNLRNGVGASDDGRTVHFVISDSLVTFHDMGTLFRDVLGVTNALYLDGSVSRLYAPGIDRHDGGRQMGPILAVTEK
ncbi:phosphodiester glycosidase family protein [Jannaschia sp. M317]|uniref:phosphodiester glycosidase family protein n=1 Tax=Jannaschia sp. M317 TaxID=2867011 RepID=UPI0021A261D9|nr:phosphodiester glycosidase family protein [Jannaschia sp. M317]